uniref:Uncharacterized protein n=1 Tax=Rhizophora mucronata TaxID=61149 RepID=A0A2P2NXI8_RHIMU
MFTINLVLIFLMLNAFFNNKC